MALVDGEIYIGLRDGNFSHEIATSIARIPIESDLKIRRLQTEVLILKLLVGVMFILVVLETVSLRSHVY